MRIQNVDLNDFRPNHEAWYLVRVVDNLFVSKIKQTEGDSRFMYFDDILHKEVISIHEVDEVSIIHYDE